MMKKITIFFLTLLAILVASVGSLQAQTPETTNPKYTVKFASGMDDTAHWSFDPAAAHTTGVEAGTQVTLTYSGSLRVKSITVSTVNPVETPLTFVANTADATVAMTANNGFGSAPTVSLQYSTDGGSTWNDFTVGSTTVTLTNVGDAVQFRATSDGNTTLGDFSNNAFNYFTLTGDCYAYGNVMSLLYNDFDEETTFPEGSSSNFFYLFKNCSTLYNHPSVELVLPATQLTNYCYVCMFYGCTGLTTAPELPATTLANYCYQYMFGGCTALTAAPVLPATQLDTNCYSSMFTGCTHLTTTPELSATTLSTNCYSSMFSGCSGLTSAPELPATTLTSGCYIGMFRGCTSLTTAPELPATTLANSCYYSMFQNCTTLTAAPVLPATTLAEGCYYGMFNGCTSLNYIKCMATDGFTASNCLNNWVSGVAPTGDFYCYSANGWRTNSLSGIPSGWTVHATLSTPLTFEAKVAGATVAMAANNGFGSGSAPAVSLQYSTDGGSSWSDFTVGSTSVTLTNVGDAVQFRAKSDATHTALGNSSSFAYNYFTLTGDCYAYGNVMSLLYNDFDEETTFPEGSSSNFYSLFYNCSTLYNHPSVDLVLPATQLANYCYGRMFYGCTHLTEAPELPATQLAPACYYGMFQNCIALTTAPELPATTLVNYCYYGMFQGCTGLTTAPELPATTLTPACYNNMFWGCTSLTTAPALPATTLATECYRSMFHGCTGLTTGPTIAATTFGDGGECEGMFANCTNLTSITWTGDFSGSVEEDEEEPFADIHLGSMLPSGSTGTINCPSSMTATWNALKGYINGGSWTVQAATE